MGGDKSTHASTRSMSCRRENGAPGSIVVPGVRILVPVGLTAAPEGVSGSDGGMVFFLDAPPRA